MSLKHTIRTGPPVIETNGATKNIAGPCRARVGRPTAHPLETTDDPGGPEPAARARSVRPLHPDPETGGDAFLLRQRRGPLRRTTPHHLQAEGAPPPPFQVLPLCARLLPPPREPPLRVHSLLPPRPLPRHDCLRGAVYPGLSPSRLPLIPLRRAVCARPFPRAPQPQARLPPPGLGRGRGRSGRCGEPDRT
jgi:hypothetical protein